MSTVSHFTTRRQFLARSLTSSAAARMAVWGLLPRQSAGAEVTSSAKDTGYRGIWFTLGQKSEHGG